MKHLRSIIIILSLCSSGTCAQERVQPVCSGAVVTHADVAWDSDRGAWSDAAAEHDGILAIEYCLLFEAGPTTVRRLSPAEVGALPPGFTLYNNLAFEIRTQAVVSRTHSMTLKVPSADKAVFDSLLVLYLEEDPMNPGTLQWTLDVDPRHQAPPRDFNKHTLGAWFELFTLHTRATNTARIAVAAFGRAAKERAPAADLAVTSINAPAEVAEGGAFSTIITVTNKGPQPATDVLLNHVGYDTRWLVSAEPSQGQCRRSERSFDTVICQLGVIKSGASVTVRVAAKADGVPQFADGSRPRAPKITEIKAPITTRVRAKEREVDVTNNSVKSTITVKRRRG